MNFARKLAKKIMPHKLSSAEKIAKIRAKVEEGDEKGLRRQQITEATFYAQMIPNALARLKIATITKHKNKLQINKVRVRPPILIHEDYYMLEINTTRLPYGIRIENLKDPEVLTTLSAACRIEVEVKFNPVEGFWYLIPRRGGLGIIPRIIDYEDVIEMIPASCDIWAFPIGVTENKRLIWIDLRKTPHMLLIGSTGAGKTVFLKSLIYTLAMNCSPKRLRFVICDFKRGPDFKALAELPHLGTPLPVRYDKTVTGLTETGELEHERTGDYMDRILTDLGEIVEVLQWARKEIDRRNAMFDQDITDIDRWNAKHRKAPLPHVVIIVDEIGVIMNRLAVKEQSILTEQLADIAMLGRSAGIHLTLGLQKLVKKILDGSISDNIEARIVGLCASGPQSAMAMGNGSWSAARLPKIKGRAMWRDVDGELEVQLPWVDPKVAIQLTEQVINKWVGGQDSEDKLAMEVFKWCLEEQNGDYNTDRVYQHWRTMSVNRAQIQSIRDDYLLKVNEENGEPEPIFRIDGVDHVMVPHIPGVRPARVITKAKYDQANQPEEPPAELPPPAPKHDVTPEELFAYSLEQLNGNFAYKKLHAAFQERGIPRAEIEKIGKDYEGQEIQLNGKTYLLEPSSGTKPRRLVACGLLPNDQPPKAAKNGFGDNARTLENWPDMPKIISDDDQTAEESDEIPDWLMPELQFDGGNQ